MNIFAQATVQNNGITSNGVITQHVLEQKVACAMLLINKNFRRPGELIYSQKSLSKQMVSL